MSTTLERIKEFIDSKGLSIQRFEKNVGFSNGAFASQLKKGKTIGVDKLENILTEYPEIDTNWLLKGVGEMTKTVNHPIGEPVSKMSDPQSNQGIPLIPLAAVAGLGEVMDYSVNFSHIEERYNVPLFDGKGVDYLTYVRGSSMYPKYSSGDVVACKFIRENLFIQWGKVYVLDTKSQGPLIKRLFEAENNAGLICTSDNEKFKDFIVPFSDVRSISIVIGVIRLE